MSKRYLIFGALAASLAVVSCNDSLLDQIAVERTVITNLQINTTAELPLLVGTDSLLNFVYAPNNPSNAKLQWSSSDESVATVSEDGNVKAVSLGTATITVKSTDGGARSANITVKVISSIDYITNITVTGSSQELFEDEVLALTAGITPANATYKTLKWTSSDPSIATVSETGEVTGIKPGTVTITAASTDGSGKKGTITLTIKEVVPLTGIAISTVLTETMAIDQLLPVAVTLTPSNATAQSLEWTSDNPAVATVTNTGVVKGIADGKALITVTAKNDASIKASIEVTVEAGKIDDRFMDGVTPRWITPSSGASIAVQNNIMWVTMGTSGNNKRGDIRRTNTTLHIGNYPIIAFKFTRPLPAGGNIFFDTNMGRWKQTTGGGNNQMTILTDKNGEQVFYADMGTFNTFGTTGFSMPTTAAYTFTQISVGVADMPTAQNPLNPYPVYWIKTFKTLGELQNYINK